MPTPNVTALEGETVPTLHVSNRVKDGPGGRFIGRVAIQTIFFGHTRRLRTLHGRLHHPRLLPRAFDIVPVGQ